MPRFIQHSERVTEVSYAMFFQISDSEPGHGYAFECTEAGELLPFTCDAAKASYARVIASPDKFVPKGIDRREHRYNVPSVILCDRCDREVILDGFTNTCDCGADYSMSGQILAPRSQWAEEAGESLSDILRIA